MLKLTNDKIRRSLKTIELTAAPADNTNTCTWDCSVIPNYKQLVLYQSLCPEMKDYFDMGNYDCEKYPRPWKMTWTYDNETGALTVFCDGYGPEVHYGTADTTKTIIAHYNL